MLQSSLYLIEPENLRIHVWEDGFEHRKRRVQANFTYQDLRYGLIVTDPVAERVFLANQDGDYDLNEAYLCISLGEPFNGACYKLVAAIISKELVSGDV